jgi:hypothetical protein
LPDEIARTRLRFQFLEEFASAPVHGGVIDIDWLFPMLYVPK